MPSGEKKHIRKMAESLKAFDFIKLNFFLIVFLHGNENNFTKKINFVTRLFLILFFVLNKRMHHFIKKHQIPQK